jgi:hypothetical protein
VAGCGWWITSARGVARLTSPPQLGFSSSFPSLSSSCNCPLPSAKMKLTFKVCCSIFHLLLPADILPSL